MPHERKVGVLLAGGESRRFGVPKAFSSYKGKAMYQWALDALAPLVEKTVVISHPTLIGRFKQECALPVLEDEEKYRGLGPLAGIYTAFKNCPGEWFYVMPCDTPLITSDVFAILEKHLPVDAQGITSMIMGRLQPLISIFHKDLYPVMEQLLSQRILKMSELMDHAEIMKLELSDHFSDNQFVNVNTKTQLKSLENMNG